MTSAAVIERVPRHDDLGLMLVPLFLVLSLGVHFAAFEVLAAHASRTDGPPPKPLELVMVDVPKPPPPPPEEKKPDPPKQKPPPIKVASVKTPPPPKVDEPPPPNDTPPPETPSKPVPLITGISLSSTTTGGGFAAPVGNTLYGKIGDKAVAPQDVKPYVAPHYTPIYQVDSEPEVDHEVKPDYPAEARKAGVEGFVMLDITVDDNGKVVSAKVLSGPGYGCNEAALKAIWAFRFKPAKKNGEAVSTNLKYKVTFLLD